MCNRKIADNGCVASRTHILYEDGGVGSGREGMRNGTWWDMWRILIQGSIEKGYGYLNSVLVVMAAGAIPTESRIREPFKKVVKIPLSFPIYSISPSVSIIESTLLLDILFIQIKGLSLTHNTISSNLATTLLHSLEISLQSIILITTTLGRFICP